MSEVHYRGSRDLVARRESPIAAAKGHTVFVVTELSGSRPTRGRTEGAQTLGLVGVIASAVK